MAPSASASQPPQQNASNGVAPFSHYDMRDLIETVAVDVTSEVRGDQMVRIRSALERCEVVAESSREYLGGMIAVFRIDYAGGECLGHPRSITKPFIVVLGPEALPSPKKPSAASAPSGSNTSMKQDFHFPDPSLFTDAGIRDSIMPPSAMANFSAITLDDENHCGLMAPIRLDASPSDMDAYVNYWFCRKHFPKGVRPYPKTPDMCLLCQDPLDRPKPSTGFFIIPQSIPLPSPEAHGLPIGVPLDPSLLRNGLRSFVCFAAQQTGVDDLRRYNYLCDCDEIHTWFRVMAEFADHLATVITVEEMV